MFCIVGLGNPEKKYENTRHNIGFDVIDAVADKYSIAVREKGFKALFGKGMIEGQRVILVKPQTYMNLSGESVREITDYFKIDPEEELIVISDDISLGVGGIRIRKRRRIFSGSGWVWGKSRKNGIWRIMCWGIFRVKSGK